METKTWNALKKLDLPLLRYFQKIIPLIPGKYLSEVLSTLYHD